MGFRGSNIEESDAAARDAADSQDCVKRVRRMVVSGVTGGPRDFEDAITAGQGLANV